MSQRFSEQFEREARAVAALRKAPDYMVMEYIAGAPLAGPLPRDQALRYGA